MLDRVLDLELRLVELRLAVLLLVVKLSEFGLRQFNLEPFNLGSELLSLFLNNFELALIYEAITELTE